MGKGPGLHIDIGKKARGDSSLTSFLAYIFFLIFCIFISTYFCFFFLHIDKMLLLFFLLLFFQIFSTKITRATNHKFTITTYTSSGVVHPSLDLIS